MFQVGDLVEGFEYNEAGDEVKVVGTYVCTTDDPEEMIQDIIVKTEDGRTVYIDEQVARLHTPEVKWTLAKVRNGFHDLPNERFHTFAVKYEGEVVGELKFDRGRWKSAGGPAWKGTLSKTSLHGRNDSSGCVGIAYYSKDKRKILEWFKTGKCA